jgi:hypothetical protein
VSWDQFCNKYDNIAVKVSKDILRWTQCHHRGRARSLAELLGKLSIEECQASAEQQHFFRVHLWQWEANAQAWRDMLRAQTDSSLVTQGNDLDRR